MDDVNLEGSRNKRIKNLETMIPGELIRNIFTMCTCTHAHMDVYIYIFK